MSLTGTDWLFTFGAALLAAAGVALLLWALWGDWLRGALAYRRTGTRRRRCPKCWYDMAGVEGLRCPECGRAAKREARLHRSTRKRWAVVAACLTATLAWCASRVPSARRNGWPAAIPTTAMILSIPWLNAEDDFIRRAKGLRPAWSHAVWNELVNKRLPKETLFQWQRWALLRLCMPAVASAPRTGEWTRYQPLLSYLSHTPLTDAEWREWMPRIAPAVFQTRSQWPEGFDLFMTINTPLWQDSAYLRAEQRLADGRELRSGVYRVDVMGCMLQSMEWRDGADLFASAAKRAESLPLDLWAGDVGTWDGSRPPREFRYGRLELPVRISGTLDECMRRVSIPDVDAALRAGAYSFEARNGTVRVWVDAGTTQAITEALRRENATFGVKVEILCDGEPVFERRQWWGIHPGDRSMIFRSAWPLLMSDGWVRMRDPENYTLRLRITPDQEMALRDYDSERCWDGEPIEVPLALRGQESASQAR